LKDVFAGDARSLTIVVLRVGLPVSVGTVEGQIRIILDMADPRAWNGLDILSRWPISHR
jgi:hypothetical protein